jgi:azurin
VSLTSADPEVIDFKTANVTIVGTLALKGTGSFVINAAAANLTLGDNAGLALGANGVLIKKSSMKIPLSGKGKVANVFEKGEILSGDIAMKDFTLSSDSVPSGVTAVYVFGTLTADASSKAPEGKVIAIGKVVVKGTSAKDLSKVDVNNATISVDVGTASVTLGKQLAGTRFSLGQGHNLTVLRTTDITASVKGEGELTLGEDVIHADISGDGHVVFTRSVKTDTTKFTAPTNSVIAKSVKFTNGLATSDNSVVTLGGKVILPEAKAAAGTTPATNAAAITFASITDASIKLKANTVISSGTVPVLSVGTDTTLKGDTTTGATITAGASKLTIATHPITIDGKVNVNDKAELVVDSAVTVASGSLTVKGTLDAAAASSVVVGGADKVTFSKAKITGDKTTGATLKGTGKVAFAPTDVLLLADGGALAIEGNGEAAFGATVLSGAGSWTASGATGGTAGTGVAGVTLTSAATGATIGFNAGAGGWKDATLTADKTPVITQGTVASSALVIGANVTLNLSGPSSKAGEIVLVADKTNAGADAGKLSFAATSKVLVGAGTGGAAIAGTTGVKIGGKDVVVTGLGADDFQVANSKLVQLGGKTAGSLAAKDTDNVIINSLVDASGT